MGKRRKYALNKGKIYPKLNKLMESKKKGSKFFRKIFELKRGGTVKKSRPTETRENIFNFSHSPETEKKLFTLWQSSMLKNEVRGFLYKVANNTLKLNIHMSKFVEEKNDKCTFCFRNDMIHRENFLHFYTECPNTIDSFIKANRIIKSSLNIGIEVLFKNDQYNQSTWFEKIMSGIVLYVIFKNREKNENRVLSMNIEFEKIVSTACITSKHFNSMIRKNLNRSIDPF